MPELPEVQTVVDTLQRPLVGARFSSVRLLRADILKPRDCDLRLMLQGRTVTSITRRAKRIVFALDDGNRFYVHLGMTGRLTTERADADLVKHTHLICRIQGTRRELRFRDTRRFGGIWWLGTNGSDESHLGPEPLTLRAGALFKQLVRTKRAVKNALLDQRVIAGIGNIYADESLFVAGIHPLTPANKLSKQQTAKLTRAIKRTLRKAIHHRGSTLRDYVDANGGSGGFQRLHTVYGRAGQPCRRCRSSIERIVLGGRSAHFCPECQPVSRMG